MSDQLQTFLDGVTAEIRCQEVHAEIRDELQEHIVALREEHIAAGKEPDAALEVAIRQMGAPAEIGRRFNQVHRPRIEWGLIALTGLLTLVGLMVSWFGEGSPRDRVVLAGLGLAAGAPLLFADYRRFRRWGWPLFGLMAVLIAWLGLFGRRYIDHNQLTFWSLLLTASPLLFALAFTAISAGWDWQRRRHVPLAFGLLLLPMLLYKAEWPSYAMTYAILWTVQFFASRPPRGVQIAFGALTSAGVLLMGRIVLSAPYRLARLLAWLNLDSDPNGAGYYVLQSIAVLREAGLFGHGLSVRPEVLPDPTVEFVFPYIVHTVGWLGGVALLLLIAGFGLRLLQAARQIREPFGASLMRLVGASLILDGGWNLLMVTGILPVKAAPLPFISGDSSLLYQFALMGLALGVYRMKDLLPTAPRRNPRPGAPA